MMIPKAYFERIGSPVPPSLTDDDIDRGECANTGWWSGCQPTQETLDRLRQLCLHDRSWDETEEYVADDMWGSDLRIWKEEGRVWSVTFRFSPITEDLTLLIQFVSIVRDAQCLLLNVGTGLLLEPEDAAIVECLKSSRAMRFVEDPMGTIVKAARETQL